jgi:hypothetical protein
MSVCCLLNSLKVQAYELYFVVGWDWVVCTHLRIKNTDYSINQTFSKCFPSRGLFLYATTMRYKGFRTRPSRARRIATTILAQITVTNCVANNHDVGFSCFSGMSCCRSSLSQQQKLLLNSFVRASSAAPAASQATSAGAAHTEAAPRYKVFKIYRWVNVDFQA